SSLLFLLQLYDSICHQVILIWHLISIVCYLFRCRVAYTNYVKSWNNVILKVRDLPIHVFIEQLRSICSEMSYTYREKAEMSQYHITPWSTDHCEGRKFVVD
ncbi:hypothetical protein GIB67_007461, partial [Kingdonia uniflora]